MKKIFSLYLLFFCVNSFSQELGGIINTYARVTAINSCYIVVDSSSGFKKEDQVLIIQMKGAEIDQTNTSSFGEIIDFGKAGAYEDNTILNVRGDTFYLKKSVLNEFEINHIVQIVGIRPYKNINTASTILAKPWNGNTGGVIYLNATDSITISDSINAVGVGFRGGDTSKTKVRCGPQDYYVPYSSGFAGAKGESIATLGIEKIAGIGPLATGGGGGGNNNTGGGGGSNAGIGGIGGNEFLGNAGTCPNPTNKGGLPGNAIDYTDENIIALGGGGGGGQQNNYFDKKTISHPPHYGRGGTKGGNGGRIIFINSQKIIPLPGAILDASGVQTSRVAGRDGAGGGGAGGTIMIIANDISSNLPVVSKGGAGGDLDNNNISNSCHGPGGGGGGGTLITSKNFSASIAPQLSGGRAGLTLNQNTFCANTSFGAASGSVGKLFIKTRNNVSAKSSCPFNELLAVNDQITIKLGETISIENYLNNDSYSGLIKIIDRSTSTTGSYSFNSGKYFYTASNVTIGYDTLIYEIEEKNAPYLSSTAKIIINVTEGNRTPVAINDTITLYTNSLSSHNPTLNDIDLDGDNLTLSLLTNFNLGTTSIVNNKISYQVNFNSGKQTLDYQICDPYNQCDEAQIVINVIDTNRNPVAINDTVYILTNTDLILNPITNDQDPNGDVLTLTSIGSSSLAEILVVDNTIQIESLSQEGSESFTYVVCDPFTSCDEGRIFLIVNEIKELEIPEGFSPNDDGINDFFEISNIEDYEAVQLRIFNRWGQLIFEEPNYINNWSGESKYGGTLPDGTYYYAVKTNTGQEYKGYVVIKR